LGFKGRGPRIKAFPFSDLFGLHAADGFRNLFRRHFPAGFKPYFPRLVALRASISRHAPRTPFRLFFIFRSGRLRGSAHKNGPRKKQGPFPVSAGRRRIARPNRCFNFPQ
jgi:hypothetical protein